MQITCAALFVLLPLTNGMRADLHRGVFYFGGRELGTGDGMMVFWCGMLALWGLVTMSFLYGRLWCGWLCPQTAASDFSESIDRRLKKALRANRGGVRRNLARLLRVVIVSGIALATGIVLVSYWLAPDAVITATRNPGSDIPAALAVYSLAAALAADMLWVRRKFCTDVCPYGALIGTLADRNTLAVRYLDERDSECIRCGKCEIDCPMGIDIKKGVGQYACIGCGECVDSCNDVLGRRGIAGLIEYRYGLDPDRGTRKLSGLQRLGLWDNRRLAVVAALGGFAVVALWSVFGRLPMAANVTANGAVVRNAGEVFNTYTLMVENGSADRETYTVTLAGIPGRVAAPPGPIVVDGRGRVRVPLTLAAPASALIAGGTEAYVTVASSREHVRIPLIFYTPR
ncbi:MAG: 4Fe-4S dicluster domain-containing protein [Capsulimonadaceae bacterium]